MPTDLGEGVQRYRRSEWGARYGRGVPAQSSRNSMFAHTTVTDLLGADADVSTEKAVMRSMERYHVQGNGWSGIGYAEVVTDSGRVYEGRGPERSLAHATGHNRSAYGFAHMGHGDRRGWLSGGWKAMRVLAAWYRRRGWLNDGYKVFGHRDVSSKTCPGTKVSDSKLQRELKDASLKDNSNDTDTDMEDLMSELGAPITIVLSDKGNWYLILNWEAKYSYIKSGEALNRLKERADDPDDKRYELRGSRWHEDWFEGMIEEEVRV